MVKNILMFAPNSEKKLPRNNEGRLFVHLFIWTHPDSDHCDGVADHFHLGKPEDWSEKNDKIFINEIWSSPIVFRRHHAQNHPLCDDAIALNKEVKRRVNLYKEKNYLDGVGNQGKVRISHQTQKNAYVSD